MVRSVLTVVGARPQFIKAAPVSRALAEAGWRETMVHTGQHFDPSMSAVFFDELAIPAPAIELNVHGLPHGAMTGRMLEGLEQAMLASRPDWVLVYGDTNSTLAGAMAAAKLHVPVAHVEAGLRSYNRRMPEEINRVVTDHLSQALLCPTATAAANLAREGIREGVHTVGDVMFDTTLSAAARAETHSRILEQLDLAPRAYAVASVHRAENTDDPVRFDAVMAWLCEAARSQTIVFPVHPRTRRLLDIRDEPHPGLRLLEPLGFLDMARLVQHSAAVYTDSGGLQKEAYFHRVPCVTLRDETEWVETVTCGWNRLWTTPDYAPRRDIEDYGRGDSARRIVDVLDRGA